MFVFKSQPPCRNLLVSSFHAVLPLMCAPLPMYTACSSFATSAVLIHLDICEKVHLVVNHLPSNSTTSLDSKISK